MYSSPVTSYERLLAKKITPPKKCVFLKLIQQENPYMKCCPKVIESVLEYLRVEDFLRVLNMFFFEQIVLKRG